MSEAAAQESKLQSAAAAGKGDAITPSLPFPDVYNSSIKFMDAAIHYQVMFLDKNVFVWVGNTEPRFRQLSVAFPWAVRCCGFMHPPRH